MQDHFAVAIKISNFPQIFTFKFAIIAKICSTQKSNGIFRRSGNQTLQQRSDTCFRILTKIASINMRHKRFLVLLAFWLSSILAHPRETHTPITLLPTTSKKTSSTPTSAPPPSSVERIEDVDREDPCSSSFFEFTEENIESSEVHSWYVKSREEWKENSPSEFRKYGEAGYFARKILGLPNFRFGVEKNGCDEGPSCETVLKQTEKFLQEKNDTKTVQWGQLIFRTRQVYFVVKTWQTIGRHYHTLDVSRIVRPPTLPVPS
jgi:hypothetical protein